MNLLQFLPHFTCGRSGHMRELTNFYSKDHFRTGLGTLPIPVTDGLRIRSSRRSRGDPNSNIVNILPNKYGFHQDAPNFIVFVCQFHHAFCLRHRGGRASIGSGFSALSSMAQSVRVRYTCFRIRHDRFGFGALSSTAQSVQVRFGTRAFGYGTIDGSGHTLSNTARSMRDTGFRVGLIGATRRRLRVWCHKMWTFGSVRNKHEVKDQGQGIVEAGGQ
ncbi:hypothetical protein B0H11DRAFT_2429673 [Mycena galericulata]|nr:hypothetical protein B0H11DRAFT_2429673 [Mycena galericulata]